MEQFTEEETKRLAEILRTDVNPYVKDEGETFSFPLGSLTERWLFKTHMNLPVHVQDELSEVLSENIPTSERVSLVDSYLWENQISSAPQWWELNFFEFRLSDLWKFIVEQCRKHYGKGSQLDVFDELIAARDELNEARHTLQASKYNKDRFSAEKLNAAREIYDRSYPLDFRDYNEAPRTIRSPLEEIQCWIRPELSDLESVFSKRWFEFKILDELASFELYRHDGERDSKLSKQIYHQLQGFMFGELMALGRMVEHYRWKFGHLRKPRAELRNMIHSI